MRPGMFFKLTQAHYFYENDKNKAITGWKFKNRRRIIIMYINLYKKKTGRPGIIQKSGKELDFETEK